MTRNDKKLITFASIFLFIYMNIVTTNIIYAEKSADNETNPTKPIINFSTDYKLQGIFIGENHKYCIINNHILGVGSTIQDIKIISIDLDSVLIENLYNDTFQLIVNVYN
ncbi:MAG: hypothetical protein K9G11_02245 [Rickettsiaceae bacterium]|nr:hypothetical protein [Rickettsiaceae bacterium]